ncbi:hypothetical protein [Aestuariivirga sp.]|uniref:hypothetical protein n=1 Tax=Aestuariivirga sp. TaxID=2650926 RepID=UPI0039E668F0
MWVIYNDDEAAAFKDLSSASDRAAAIVAASLLEDRLEMALRLRMIDDDKVAAELFRSSGPLGSFASKIALGYLLKMYSDAARRDLVCIKDISNQFAHHLDIRDFQSQSIKNKTQNLRLVEKHVFPYGTNPEEAPKDVGIKMFEQNLTEQLADPRRRYLLAVSFFVSGLTPIGRTSSNPHTTPF